MRISEAYCRCMVRSLWVNLAIWLCLLGIPVSTVAIQDDCFCLAHSSGAMLRGCEAYQAKTDFYATAVCTDPETGETAEQLLTDEWQRIPAGEDRCNPCRREPRSTADEPPRGNGGEETSPAPVSKPADPESAP